MNNKKAIKKGLFKKIISNTLAKKIVTKGLIIGILFFNNPINSMANEFNSFKTLNNTNNENLLESFFNNISNTIGKIKEDFIYNTKVVKGKTLEITLNNGEYVPNLDNNPDGYEIIKVTTLGSKALSSTDYRNLKESKIPKVDLSNSYSTVIPYDAFNNAKHLREFKFPKGVIRIDEYGYFGAFKDCINLTGNLILPETLEYIGSHAFQNCGSLTGDLIIPDSVTTIGRHAFSKCSGFDGELKLPKSITTIETRAFESCVNLTGTLVIPDTVTSIGDVAFGGCRGFTGDLLIPDSVTKIGLDAFFDIRNVDRIVIKVNDDDLETNYKKAMIDNLPNSSQTVLDVPYDFDITGTWLENTNKIIGKPVLKNVIDGVETDFTGDIAQTISLFIPVPYIEDDIVVYKNKKPYKLPSKNEDNKHLFVSPGVYQVTIKTFLGNISNLTFEIENNDLSYIEEAVQKAEETKNPEDIENARDLVNGLPESIQKDDFNNRLDDIFPEFYIEKTNSHSKFDIYIKSSNTLSMSLDTNFIKFDDFSGVENLEKVGAIKIVVDSSLPYEINAYLPSEIIGSRFGDIINKNILNIKMSDDFNYQTFKNINTPLSLLDAQEPGYNTYSIDLMLKGGLPYKKDSYRGTIKLEIKQK